jgi:hypothetical protein
MPAKNGDDDVLSKNDKANVIGDEHRNCHQKRANQTKLRVIQRKVDFKTITPDRHERLNYSDRLFNAFAP